jgi:hypothetical protein
MRQALRISHADQAQNVVEHDSTIDAATAGVYAEGTMVLGLMSMEECDGKDL